MNGPTAPKTGAGQPAPTLMTRVEENLDHRGTGLPVVLVSQVISEVAAELDRLHEAGRAHGDVQASQIAIPSRGPARLREPDLAAPFSAASVGGDVAGLVAAAYFALCGVMPSYFYPLSSLGDEASRRQSSSVLVSPSLHRADLPPSVSEVLTKGLSPQVGNRYATPGAFAAALRGVAGAPPASAPAFAFRRPRLLVSAALAACAALVTGVWLGIRHQERPTPTAVSVAVPSVIPSPPPPPPFPPPAVPSADKAAAAPKSVETQKPTPPVASKMPKPTLTPTPLPALGVVTSSAPSADTVSAPPHVFAERQDAVSKPVTLPSSPGFLRVYARQFLSARDVLQRRVSLVRARRVLVDGSPSQSLAAGRWTRLTRGKHKLAFYPMAGVPFDPNTAFWISLRPSRRQSFQVPLPRHPGGIQGFVAKKHPESPV